MKASTQIRRQTKPSEEGFVLLAVIFLVFLLTISLAVALPKVSKEIQRDREFETMERGKQYIRAVRMYYKKFGSYPPTVDALVKPTNNIRFLRKKYADPTTGKEDWKPIQYGQNKAPTAMGFFGQPLSGAATGASSGISGLNSTASSTTTATDASATTSTTSQTGSTTGLTGQTYGGVGIIGFSPNSPKKSIMVYKKKNHYNEWEFVYDPVVEQLQAAGLTGAASATGTNSNSTATPTTPAAQ
jgi:type II secretory pathway pseudopilin PulG